MRTKTSIWITLAFFAVQAVVSVAAGVGLSLYWILKKGVTNLDIIKEIQPVMLPMGYIALICSGYTVFALTRRALPASIDEGGLQSIGWSPARFRDIIIGVCLGLLSVFIFVVITYCLYPHKQGQILGPPATATLAGGWQLILWSVMAILIAPPIEEFVFRGVLWSGLRQSMSGIWAGIIVTVLFIFCHATEIFNYRPVCIGIILLGIGTVVMRSYTKSLVPAVALHASYNLGIVIITCFFKT